MAPLDEQPLAVRVAHLEKQLDELRASQRRIEEGQQAQAVLMARVEARLAHPPVVMPPAHVPVAPQQPPPGALSLPTIGALVGAAVATALARYLGV